MKIEDWGLIPYREAWDRQKDLVNKLIENNNSEEIIALVEHPAVYTLGFHGNKNNLLLNRCQLEVLGVECISIERGGDITYHGPGQLVVYPIINLHKHGLGVKKYIHLLEDSVRELLGLYGIESSSNDDAIGVWLDWQNPSARKICAIGVKISRGISMHGLALNVNTDLSGFLKINPCGFTDKGVTSMSKELNREVDFKEVKSRLADIILKKLYS